MNPHLKRFFLVFFLIGTVVCAVLAVANASTKPASASGAVVFGVSALVLACAALLMRRRREA